MSRYYEPRVSTRVTNPTKQQQGYRWLADGGFNLDPGQSILFPFEIMSASKADTRPDIEEALRTGRVQLEYLVRGITVTQVDSLPTDKCISETPPAPVKPYEGPAAQPDLFPPERPEPGQHVFRKEAMDAPKLGPGKVKTFREVMGWPKQEAAPAAPVQTLQEAWTDRLKHPKF